MDRRGFLGLVAAAFASFGLEELSAKEKRKSVILPDGDWGGDELQLLATLRSNPDIEIPGATSVFGNTTGPQTFTNARNIFNYLGAEKIPVYAGADRPSGTTPQEGDGAHGNDGIGGVNIPNSPAKIQTGKAVDFILSALKTRPEGSVTITASGPLTNIAEAFRQNPKAMRRVSQIIVMGGCTEDLPAHDMQTRRGNITPHAEFNFYMAPKDAETVLNSGLPIVLLPMNCTQALSLTPAREQAIRDTFKNNQNRADEIIKMMSAPAEFDMKKFGAPPFMHDVHCALYALKPELYQTARGRIIVVTEGEQKGRTEFTPGDEGNVTVATKLLEPDKAFELFLSGLTKAAQPAMVR